MHNKFGMFNMFNLIHWTKKNLFFFIFFFLLMIAPLFHTSFAKTGSPPDLYPFTDPHLAQRFNHLTHELRCLVCQNQNLADSDAALAADLRQKIYTQIQNGESDTEIKNYFVQRYGDFVLYQPPIQNNTWLLWSLPFIMLFLGFIILFIQIYSNRRVGSVYNSLYRSKNR